MIQVDLYDTEFCYGFDVRFKNEQSLNEFVKLNPRYDIENIRIIEE